MEEVWDQNVESALLSGSRRSFLIESTAVVVAWLLSSCWTWDDSVDETNEGIDLALGVLPESALDEQDFVTQLKDNIMRKTGQTQTPLTVPEYAYSKPWIPSGVPIANDYQPWFGVKRLSENQFQLGLYVNSTHMSSDGAMYAWDELLPPDKNEL